MGRDDSRLAAIAARAAVLAGCTFGAAKRQVAGGATVSGEQVLDVDAGAPRRIYVAQFAIAEGAMKPASGIAAGAADIVEARPHLLGGGILGRRLTADTPSGDTVLATLATSITNALNAQQLGVPAEQMPPGAPCCR